MDSANHLIPAALEQMLRNQPLSTGKVDFAWRVAVGQGIERATSVTLRTDGVLEVRAVDPQWENEVRRLSAVIVARLQRMLGTDVVRQLRVARVVAPNGTRSRGRG